MMHKNSFPSFGYALTLLILCIFTLGAPLAADHSRSVLTRTSASRLLSSVAKAMTLENWALANLVGIYAFNRYMKDYAKLTRYKHEEVEGEIESKIAEKSESLIIYGSLLSGALLISKPTIGGTWNGIKAIRAGKIPTIWQLMPTIGVALFMARDTIKGIFETADDNYTSILKKLKQLEHQQQLRESSRRIYGDDYDEEQK